jgi:hypothetical protein
MLATIRWLMAETRWWVLAIRKRSEKSIGWPNITIGRRKMLRGSQRHSFLVLGPP